MQTQVTTLYNFGKTKYNLTIHGGRGGFRNSVSWVYLAEDIQNVSFLKGGELVITTGLFTQSGASLLDFLRALVLKSCCGLLINVGKYLLQSDITPEVVAFCNINKFPLFSFPWEVHLVDLMQDYSILLLHDNQSADTLSAAFQSTLYQTPIPDNILRTLNQYGFPTDASYRVIAIRNLRNTTRITSPLNQLALKYHLFSFDNLQILIYQVPQDPVSLLEIVEVLCFCDSILIGISDMVHSLTSISQCYKRARFSLSAAEFWKRPYVNFEEMGLFQILFHTSDITLLQTIYQRYLGYLEEFDKQHDSDYLNTLRIYLLCDCNLLETANRLFMHRNTIVYRIKKIKELLHIEFDHATDKFNLLMAFYIKEYLSI